MLEEKIEVLIKGICLLIEAVKANTDHRLSYTVTTDNQTVEAKSGKRNRRTKAQIAEDNVKKEGAKPGILDPAPSAGSEVGVGTDFDLDPVPQAPASLTPDPLAVLDTPPLESTGEEIITEEKLRAAASALCDIGGPDGLATAKEIIKKAGFAILSDVYPKKYKVVYDAFRLAVETWKK